MSDQKESEWKKLHSRLQFCLVIQDLKFKKSQNKPQNKTLHTEQIQHGSEMYVAITYYKGWNHENTSAKREKTGLVQIFSESNPPQNKTRGIIFCTPWTLKWTPNEMKVPAVPHGSLKFETSHLKGSVQLDFFLEIRVSPLVDNI